MQLLYWTPQRTAPAHERQRYAARHVCRVGTIDCVGGRDGAAEARRAPDEPDETCWPAGDAWWLSTAPYDV